MPLRIFNNLSSVIAQNRLDTNNRNLGEAISRIASGNRLTGSKVNAAEKTTSELPLLEKSVIPVKWNL